MNAPEYVAVRAHVVKAGRVLLGLHRRRHLWTTFGGKVEHGETVDETLRRELREELGIVPTELQRLGDRTHDWDGAPARIAIFAVAAWEGEAHNLAPHEHEAIDWFTAEQIERLPMAEEARREALALLGNLDVLGA